MSITENALKYDFSLIRSISYFRYLMNLHKKLEPYLYYLKLTEKERKKRIDKAEQDTNYRPNPQRGQKFPEIDTIKFVV